MEIRLKNLVRAGFALALIVPLFFLFRMMLDRFLVQAQRIQDKVFEHQLRGVGEIEEAYDLYCETLRGLVRQFSRDPVFRRFPGSKRDSLWLNQSEYYSEYLDFHPRQKTKHLLAYSKFRLRFKKKITQAIYPPGKEVVSFQSPLLLQVFVLEHSLFSQRMQNTYPESFTYENILTTKTTRAFTIQGELDDFLEQNKLRDFFHTLPMHPVFYLEDEVSRMFWGVIKGLVQRLFRIYIFGPPVYHFAMNVPDATFNLDFKLSQDKFIPMTFLERGIEFYFTVFPRTYAYQQYLKPASTMEIPRAIFFILSNFDSRENLFFDQLTWPQGGKALNLVREDTLEILEALEGSGMELEFFKYNKDQRIPSNPTKRMSPRFKFFQHQAIELNKGNYKGLVSSGNQVTIDKVLGIFNPVTGSNEINSSQLLEQIQKHFFRPGIQPLQIEDIARLAILQKTPIHFLFSRDDKKYCGTLYPSAAFSSGMFFLYQPISELYTPLRKEAAWLSFLFLLSILILGIPLNILFKRLINPLAVLGDGIKSLAQGEYSKRMPNQPVEDLQILADQFNEMAESVSIRIESLQSARGINDQLNQGRECTEIIQEVLTQICKSLHFDFGVAGFFEGSVSRDSRKYFWHECKEEPPDHEKILDLILSSRTSEDATLRISGEALAEAQLKEEHGLLIVSQPRETEEINIYGVLFLASSQKISNLLYLQNVVRHLRSVVVKDVLNQILSDSRKGEETQRALLPANPPPLPDEFELSHYFLAARRLAGDFYDFFLTPDQSHLIMIIADVAGKGIGSSLFGMTARTTFRLLCQKEYGTDLGGLLGELNEVMCAENFPYMFLTCFCLDLDLKSYEMKYSIAGHNKMLLARGDGSLDQLTSREIPLGLFEGIAFSEQQLALEPMDRLVLYTDGVTGMENSDLEIYGLKRLEAFVLNHLSLTSLEFQDALLKELEEFRQGVHAPDDLTLINLRRH